MLDAVPVTLTLCKDILGYNQLQDNIVLLDSAFEEDISSRNYEEFNVIWKAFHFIMTCCSVA